MALDKTATTQGGSQCTLPARAFPIKRVVQQLFNVCLIGKTFSGRQVLCQRYIRQGQPDGDCSHERPVHRGTDPTGLIRLVGNIAEIDVDVADRIQRDREAAEGEVLLLASAQAAEGDRAVLGEEKRERVVGAPPR